MKKICGGTTNPTRRAAFFNIPFRRAWGRGALPAALQSLMALKWTIHGKKCPKIVSQKCPLFALSAWPSCRVSGQLVLPVKPLEQLDSKLQDITIQSFEKMP